MKFTITFFATILLIVAEVSAQQWERLGFDGGMLREAFIDGKYHRVVLMSAQHQFYATDDFGATLQDLPQPWFGDWLSYEHSAFRFTDNGSTFLWVAVNDHYFRTDDGWETWKQMSYFPRWHSNREIFTDRYRSSDNGDTWRPIWSYIDNTGATATHDFVNVIPTADSARWFVGVEYSPKLYGTTDDGAHWTPADSGITGIVDVKTPYVFASPFDPRLLLFTCTFDRDSMVLYRSTDAGRFWQPAVNGLPLTARSMNGISYAFAPSGAIYLNARIPADSPRRLFITRDEGAHWSDGAPGFTFDLFWLSGSVAYGYVTGTRTIFRKSDTDSLWTPVFTSAVNIDRIERMDSLHLFALNPSLPVYYTTDGGDTWSPFPTFQLHEKGVTTLVSLPTAPPVLFADALRSDDGGATFTRWSPDSAFSLDHFLTVHPAHPGTVFLYASHNGHRSIFRSDDACATFTEMTTFPELMMLFLNADRPEVMYGMRGTCSSDQTGFSHYCYHWEYYISTDDGATWALRNPLRGEVSDTGASRSRALPLTIPQFHDWQCLGVQPKKFDELLRHYNWNEDEPPIYIESVTRSENGLQGTWNGTAGWSTDWADSKRFVYSPATGDTVLGVTNAALQVSSDRGRTWRKVVSDGSFMNVAVDWPAHTVYSASKSTGVRVSTDLGATWTDMNAGLRSLFVTDIALDSDGRLFAAVNTGLYRYNRTWTEAGISSQLPTTIEMEVYPNPFHNETTLRFSLPHAAAVTITVYDVFGRRLAQVCDSRHLEAGTHNLVYEHKPGAATGANSTVLLFRLTANGRTATRRVVAFR